MTCYQTFGPLGFGSHQVEWLANVPSFTPSSSSADLYLIPGFVDLHIHGAFGIDFMSASTAEILTWAENLEQIGYEALLPTTITAQPNSIHAAINRLPAHRAISGFHLEGPFISPKHPGAQPLGDIALPPLEGSEWEPILNHPKLRLVTLASEIPGALSLIAKLRARGVRVNMGHTDATYAEALAGHQAGVGGSTHTFNAMRGLHHREAGALGFALACDDLFTELIYDRVHVNREVAGILIRSKPADKLIAVSDSTMAAGLKPGTRLNMWGSDVVVGTTDVRLANGGALAGSTITLLDAFRNIASDFGIEVAIRMCCLNPRAYIGISEPPNVWLELDAKFDLLSVKRPA